MINIIRNQELRLSAHLPSSSEVSRETVSFTADSEPIGF